jgi:hypothetical protein
MCAHFACTAVQYRVRRSCHPDSVFGVVGSACSQTLLGLSHNLSDTCAPTRQAPVLNLCAHQSAQACVACLLSMHTRDHAVHTCGRLV